MVHWIQLTHWMPYTTYVYTKTFEAENLRKEQAMRATNSKYEEELFILSLVQF